MDVLNHAHEMTFVAYISIEVLLHPERATAAQYTIRLLGGKRLPSMQERRLNPTHAFGKTLLAICDLLKLLRHPVQDFSWQAVIQPKHNMLRHAPGLRVEQVTPRSEPRLRPAECFKHRAVAIDWRHSLNPPCVV